MPTTQPALDRDSQQAAHTIYDLASIAGVKVVDRRIVRLPFLYLSSLMRAVEAQKQSGRLSIDYDGQGRPGFVTWEGGS